MKTLITFIICALSFTASAQHRYARYTLPSTNTVSTINSNSVATYNSKCDVGPTTRADIRFAFKLTSVDTNPIPAGCTNWVTAVFDKSLDEVYWTNGFTLAVRANSNAVVWTQTNVSVIDAVFIRLVCITNDNAAKVTNRSIFLGYKLGL